MGTWEVCMCDVWARVRVCEDVGMFIYGVCVRERERQGRQDCACVGPQTPVYFRKVRPSLGLPGVWTPR